MRRRHRRSTGQALVEFTLAASLIFFLVAAAVDLGLMFFSFQALRTAAQEGATFGSYPIAVTANKQVTEVRIDYARTIDRIRTAAGNPSRGIVDLHDLNNNGLDDKDEGIVPKTAPTGPVTTGPIQISNPYGSDPNDLSRECRTTTPLREMRNAGDNCWIRIRLTYDYQFFFPLAPAFLPKVPLTVTYTLPIRSQFSG